MLVYSLEYIDLMEIIQYMNEGEFCVLVDIYDLVYLYLNLYFCVCLVLGFVFRLVDVVLGVEIWNGMVIIRFFGYYVQYSFMDGYCMFNYVVVVVCYV